MEVVIRRGYPTTREHLDARYDKGDFERYQDIKGSLDKYEKWKIGINYNTNRRIKIGGKIHRKLDMFYIKGKLFTELDGIDHVSYIEETEKLQKEIQDYNTTVNNVIEKINSLESWGQYIEFEGIKYGIQRVCNGIHRDHDCFGKIQLAYTVPCSCSTCENWNGCGRGDTKYYVCNKCNYKFSKKDDY